jgi:hypothetical protein
MRSHLSASEAGGWRRLNRRKHLPGATGTGAVVTATVGIKQLLNTAEMLVWVGGWLDVGVCRACLKLDVLEAGQL